MLIRDEKLGDFLDRLADRVPAPGGGAVAALHAALGAALLGMVARYTTGERYAEHQVTISRIITEVDELRGIALRLAEADADAFTAVSDAYALPKSTDEEKAARSAAIGQALVNAAWPPAQVISVAGMVVDLAEALVAIGNPNVISDVAAAAEAARAACSRAASSSARSTQSRPASGKLAVSIADRIRSAAHSRRARPARPPPVPRSRCPADAGPASPSSPGCPR